METQETNDGQNVSDDSMEFEDFPQIGSDDLVNYILTKVGDCSHLKLQKLVYYVDAWHLVFFNQQLITDEFQAWIHGPVSVKLWHSMKKLSVLNRNVALKDEFKEEAINTVHSILNPDQIEMINDVLAEYGSKTSYELERLTHSEKPWLSARQGLAPSQHSNKVISKNLMKEFYANLLDRINS